METNDLLKLRRYMKRIVKAQSQPSPDYEVLHSDAVRLLIEYINDDKVTKLFEAVVKW